MNLISKKDLLAITGISYGQLYRWKRERLIPEEWFIKQSAYTGQETFFPREQMLSRIQSILDLKDKYSLEELARILSPETSDTSISMTELEDVEEIEKELLLKLPHIFTKERFEFFEIVMVIAISQAAVRLGLSNIQKEELLRKSISTVSRQKSTSVTCTIFYLGNEYYTVLSPDTVMIDFDDRIEVKERINLREVADHCKIKYKNKLFH